MSVIGRVAPFLASGRKFATWDATTKGADVSITNGGLTASSNYTGAGAHCIGATIGKTSGYWSWEVTIDSIAVGGVYPMLGVAAASFAVATADYPGSTIDSIGYYGGSGNRYTNGSPTTFGSPYTTGDVLRFELDAVARTCQVFKNNVSMGIFPALGGTDAIFPVGIESSTVTANFGATPFNNPPTSGFNTGLYE